MAKGMTELELEELEGADELLDRANHDIAKYMAMTARNVEAEMLDEELRAALHRDLIETDGRRPAWVLWADFSAPLAEVLADDRLLAIDETMSKLAELLEGDREAEGVDTRLIELTRRASAAITALRREVRQRLIEAGH